MKTNNMTIQEAKEKKLKLQQEINDLIGRFKEEVNLNISVDVIEAPGYGQGGTKILIQINIIL